MSNLEGIVHIRIDDRLIHGQVAAFWSNSLRVNRIMVINNKVAQDEMTKSALRMVAPEGMRTSLISMEKAVNNITEGKYKGQRVLVILKNITDVLELKKTGLDIQEVNIGNMSKRAETTQIKRSISVSDEEVLAIKELLANDVKITARMVPDEGESSIKEYLDKAKL